MTVEVRPMGVACNLRCSYCYQSAIRRFEDGAPAYDVASMMRALERQRTGFSLFGGEPLLLPKRDLRALFRFGYNRWGGSGIQTNGALIDDDHLRMFEEFNVHVGVSVDGPGELNAARCGVDLTERTQKAIRRLAERRRCPSLGVTIHRLNATRSRLPLLLEWIGHVVSVGVRSVRLHMLEVDDADTGRALALSELENRDAFLALYEFQHEVPGIDLDPFADIRLLLLGKDASVTCVWNACDPLTTRAVQGIEGYGDLSNCGRANKDGVDYVKAGYEGYERYLGLSRTGIEDGGCRGCRYFLFCKGHCPGSAIGGDWRNRSAHCETLRALFLRTEHDLIKAGNKPISDDPQRRHALEMRLVENWEDGQGPSIVQLIGQSEVAAETQHVRKTSGRSSRGRQESVRVSWVSPEAEWAWRTVLTRLSAVFSELEILTVLSGRRPAGLIDIDPSDLPDVVARFADQGLSVVPLAKVAAGMSYQARHRQPERGEPYRYWSAVGRAEVTQELFRLQRNGDNTGIGRLLGYPECCIRAFVEDWEEKGFSDPSWFAAQRGQEHGGPARPDETLRSNAGGNVLLRWLGIRGVSHLPCTFNCGASDAIWTAYRTLGADRGLKNEVAVLDRILTWPVEWSSLHGTVVLKTPVFSVVANGDYLAHRRTARLTGGVWPEFGARGAAFPFDKEGRLPVHVLSGEARRSFLGRLWYKENGFATLNAMEGAHGGIVAAVRSGCRTVSGVRVLDLGCGNGVLLSSIASAVPEIVPFGIDRSESAIRSARFVHPRYWANFVEGDMRNPEAVFGDKCFGVALLMPGRILEMGKEERQPFLRFLKHRVGSVLCYTYDGAAAKWGSLAEMAQKAGISLENSSSDGAAWVRDIASPV